MKVIIAGGRDFTDYAFLCEKCDTFLQNRKGVEIVSGGAKGADALGELYAESRGLKIYVFLADWKKHVNQQGQSAIKKWQKLPIL